MASETAPNMRVLRILEALAEAGEPLNPTQITLALGWPKQTVHRLCQTMVANGILEKHNRKLRPSGHVNRIASGLATFSMHDTACHQILRKVAREVGETVNFARPEKPGMIYVDRVETNWPFRVLLPIGTHVPFHCTASGKTYLANLPPAKRRNFVANLTLDPLTKFTHTTPDSLEAELTAVRKSGFALDREEFHLDMVAIAVPVRDQNNRFFAALAVHGPKQRFDLNMAKDSYDLLRQSAAIISQTLFGTGDD